MSKERKWSRILAILLVVAMVFCDHSMAYAAEAMTEAITEDGAAEEAARIEAEQQAAAEAEAARQAAEEEAARQAAEEEAARQAAAAQAAAEQEAVRQAAEAQAAAEEEAARQAAEAQAAAEEEAARQAAEAQAAAEAEAARQAAEQQTAAAQSNPQEAVEAAESLILRTAEFSTQKEGEAAKLRVEYSLRADCILESVDARLYIWNENVELPQFVKDLYKDPKTGREFQIKKDEDEDLYISYSLKPGESFTQEFELKDSTVTPGTTITFDVTICAVGQVPADYSIQTTPAKVTYALPAEDTEAVAEEVISQTEELADTTEAETTRKNVVTFQVAEGAMVTANGADATNTTALAEDGTIIFTVQAAEGYEVTEVLVDGTIPARTTGNDGEYIIENIETDATVVIVSTQKVETESEETEVQETETEEPETETEETESETEKETEETTEVVYGTEFSYSDGNVTVTAVADPEAKIPADAELRADLLVPGSAAYEEAVRLLESELGIEEGYEAEYVLYDVYFLVNGEQVEPEDGLVTVEMAFNTPVFEEVSEDQEVVDYSVIHITDDAQVENVTDNVQATDEGTVESVGFTTDSFSTVGVVRVLEVEPLFEDDNRKVIQPPKYAVEYTITVNGSEYEEGTAISRDSEIVVKMNYYFKDEYPETWPNADDYEGWTYQIPNDMFSNNGFILDEIAKSGPISDPGGNNAGTYFIDDNYVVTFNYDRDWISEHNSDLAGSFEMTMYIDQDSTSDDGSLELDFPGDTHTITLKDGTLNASKSYTVDTDGNLVFTIVVTADEASTKNVVIHDVMTGDLHFLNQNPSSITATDKNGSDVPLEVEFKSNQEVYITIAEVEKDNPVTITYKASPLNANGEIGTGSNIATGTSDGTGTGTGTGNGPGFGDEKIDFEPGDNVLTKSSVQDSEHNKIVYTIKVNELAQDLNPESDTLTLRDQLDENVNFVYGSASVVQITADGKITPVYGVNYEGHVLTFTVPDEASLVITYEVSVNGKKGDVVQVTNTATLKLKDEISSGTDENFTISGSAAGMTGRSGTIIFYKIAEYTAKPLKGATFDLYEVDLDNLKGEGTHVYQATSTSNGSVQFGDTKSVSAGGIKLSQNTVYYFVETKAPGKSDGNDYDFILDDERHYFVIDATDDTKRAVEAAGIVAEYTTDGSTLDSLNNTPVPNPVKYSLEAVKKVNNSPATVNNFEFSMALTNYKPKTGGYVPESNTEALTYNEKVNNNGSKVTFPEIEFRYEGEYTFMVKETIGNGAYIYDGTGYTVVVNVARGENGNLKISSTTINGKANTSITFNNTELKSISLQKKIEGSAVSTDTEFEFTLFSTSDAFKNAEWNNINGVEVVKTNDKSLSVKMKVTSGSTESPKLTISKIPVGAKITVEEAYKEKWVVTGNYGNRTYSFTVNSDEGKNNVVFTNKYEVISHKVQKVWDDNNNVDQNRPSQITVQLKQNDSNYGAAVVLNSTNGWTYTWSDLPKKDREGKDYVYTVSESSVERYTEKSNETVNNVTTITNEPTKETVKHTVKKVWNDGNNADGVRPNKITVQLYNGTEAYLAPVEIVPDANGNWSYTWEKLPKYIGGEVANYSAKEVGVPQGYEKEPEVTSNGVTTITNKHTYTKVDKSVKKVWNDNNNEDGNRKVIEVKLLAKTTSKEFTDNEILAMLPSGLSQTVTLEGPDWSYTWKDLPEKYRGEVITYSVEEVTDLNNLGYQSTTDADNNGVADTDANGAMVITNTYTRILTKRVVEKKWDDNNNQDGKRPATIQVTLTGTVNGTVVYEDTQTLSGTDNVNGQKKLTHTWENLLVYQNGEKVDYVITERTVSEYDKPDIQSENILDNNSQKVGVKYILINKKDKETVDIQATKTWDDNNDQDGKRTESIDLTLYKKVGTDITSVGTKVANKDNSWTVEWKSLDKYENGTEIVYYINERTVPEGYVKSYVDKQNGTVLESGNVSLHIKNSHIPETTNVSVTKVWDDNNNQDGLRPTSITVTLKATTKGDNTDVDVTSQIPALQGSKNSKVITPTDEEDASKPWNTVTWEKLPVYWGGKEITYHVTEDQITDYTSEVTKQKNGSESDPYSFVVTNTHKPAKTNVNAIKIWDDNSNRDGKRPESITFQLYKTVDGIESAVEEYGNHISGRQTLKAEDYLDSDDSWMVSWSDLPEKENGKTVTYTVKEISAETGNELTDAELAPYTRQTSEDGLTITNSYIPEKTSVSVTKVWDDSNNIDNVRPGEITVRLYAKVTINGKEQEIAEICYDENTNTFIRATEEPITVTKGGTDPTGTSKTVVLKPDSNGEWPSYTWENLPKKYQGVDITYSVTEDSVDKYTSAVQHTDNAFTVTNTHITEKTSRSVRKIWEDNKDQDGIRPEELKVQLKADGETYYIVSEKNEVDGKWDGTWKETKVSIPEKTLTGDDWSATWIDLPVYNSEHKKIVYTLEEIGSITGYEQNEEETTFDEDTLTFIVTNEHETELISKQLIKFWMDQNSDTERPSTATFQLKKSVWNPETKEYDDPQVIAEKTLNIPEKSDGNIVTCSFDNLDKMWNGKPIIYEIVEKEIPKGYQVFSENKDGYTAIYNVTTKVEISKTDLTGEKEIPGAELAIIDENGKIVETWTSEENVKKVISGLIAGKEYTLHEISAPDGYLVAEDVKFTVNKDGTVTKVVMKDEPTKVYISKKDVSGEKDLKGASFAIYEGNELTDGMTPVASWTSDGGRHLLEATLKAETDYTLVEETAPNGYTKAAPIVFRIDKEGKVIVDGEAVVNNEIVVHDSLRQIRFAKADEDGNYVAGAELEVHYKTADGKVGGLAVTEDGTPMKWTSSETEAKTFSGIKKGSYYLVEISAPEGYLKVAEPQEFTVENEVTDHSMIQLVTLENTLTKVQITKSFWRGTGETKQKVDCDNPAVFDIYNANGTVAVTVKGERLENISVTSKSVITIEGLPAGDYVLHEVSAPAGYTRAEDIEFTVSEDVILSNPIEVNDCSVNVVITKKDMANKDGELLAGAEFAVIKKDDYRTEDDADTLRNKAAENVYGEKLTFTTNAEKEIILEGIVPGEYYLVEVTAPAGYVKLADPIVIKVDKDLSVTKGTITLDPIYNEPTEITILKKDKQTGELIANAELEVRKAEKQDGGSFTATEEKAVSVYGDVKTSWISEEEGYVIKGLTVGFYVLVETKVPEGYTQADPIFFEIKEDGTSTVYYGEDDIKEDVKEIEMLDDTTKVQFSKKGITESEELPGATLQVIEKLINDDGSEIESIIEEWVSGDEPYIIEGKLVAGKKYILREITAPDGYNVANDVSFEVSDTGEIQPVEMVDESTKVSFSKKSITGREELPGATLQVLKTVELEDGSTAEVVVDEWKSTEEEYLIEAVLKVGETYILREKEAPEGYTRADDVTFTVEVGGEVQKVEMIDEPIKVQISKTDLTGEKELPGATLRILNKETQEVATTIYYIDDTTTPEEKLEWVSTDEPKIIEGLPAGDYILREITAPAGYAVAEDVEFTITDELHVENKVVMKDQLNEISISKRKMTGKAELPGAKLQVLNENGEIATTIFYVDDETTPDEKLEWVSGEEAKVFKGLVPGKYTLKEVESPHGYAVAESIEFEVKEGKFEVTEVVMKDDTTKVYISKMDVANNKELAGAHLALKDSNGELIMDWYSTGKPKELVGELTAGATYTLSEISAPYGYSLAQDITFTVNSDGKIQTVVMDDKVASGNGSVIVQKLVMQNGKYHSLEDYTFYTALFADEECTQRVTSVKMLHVEQSYSTSTIFTNLDYGTYYVAETDEYGNAISDGMFIEAIDILDGKAELTPKNATAKSTIINHVVNFPEGKYNDGKITVNKTVLINGTAGKVTDTFYFALFTDAARTMPADTPVMELKLKDESSGLVTFTDLPYGDYYLAETDKDGNPVDSSYEYTVTIEESHCKITEENRTESRTVVNSKTETPSTEPGGTPGKTPSSGKLTVTTSAKTGDNNNIWLYVALMLAAMFVGAGYVIYRRKRKKV